MENLENKLDSVLKHIENTNTILEALLKQQREWVSK